MCSSSSIMRYFTLRPFYNWAPCVDASFRLYRFHYRVLIFDIFRYYFQHQCSHFVDIDMRCTAMSFIVTRRDKCRKLVKISPAFTLFFALRFHEFSFSDDFPSVSFSRYLLFDFMNSLVKFWCYAMCSLLLRFSMISDGIFVGHLQDDCNIFRISLAFMKFSLLSRSVKS